MKVHFIVFLLLLALCTVSTPENVAAQHTGNSCSASKSPFRLSLDSGKVVYSGKCTSCHQANGLGDSLSNPALVGKKITGDKVNLINFMIGGNAHKMIFPGINRNLNSLEAKYEDQQIAYVLTYIRNSFGNEASPVKKSEVSSARRKLN